MFQHKSFSQRSFSRLSWKFDDSTQPVVPADVIPYSGRRVVPVKKRKRRDTDDDVLLFMFR